MKKALLVLGLAAISSAMPVKADDETYIRQCLPNIAFEGISPNGRYVGSSIYGVVRVFDLWTGENETYLPDDTGKVEYALGNGNVLSNTGIALGSTTPNGTAHFMTLQDGWQALPVLNKNLVNSASGISADGKRICGTVGLEAMSINTSKMMAGPFIWDEIEPGVYGEPIALPCPELDLTNRYPQYITALNISEDGRTIAGQIRDYSGFLIEPIVYVQDADGNWSYKTPGRALLNPNNIQVPEYPGEEPQDAPQQENFMTAEEYAAYQKDLAEWKASGTTDYNTYPEKDNYMTSAELKAYKDALADFEKRRDDFYNENAPYFDALTQLDIDALDLEFNISHLSIDGKILVSTIKRDLDTGSTFPEIKYEVVAFYLDEDRFEILPFEESLYACSVAADGTIIANTDGVNKPKMAYILPQGKGEWQPFHEWLLATDPEVGEWFVEQISHDVPMADEEGMIYYELNYPCSGKVICTPDMSLFTSYSLCLWDDTTDMSESTIFTVKNTNGVENVAGEAASVSEVRYYNIDGTRQSGLVPGLNIRQTVYTDGTVKTEKVMF